MRYIVLSREGQVLRFMDERDKRFKEYQPVTRVVVCGGGVAWRCRLTGLAVPADAPAPVTTD
jgi:hypothetical protein